MNIREPERADLTALAALRAALPAGRTVRWRHGEHWRSGAVIEVLGFRYYHARVRISSLATGKKYDVDAAMILAAPGVA